MDPIAISIMQPEAGKEDLVTIDTLFFDPTAPEDWRLPPDELRRKTAASWRPAPLPGGETIELSIAISTRNNGFSMGVRQEGKEIARLLCEGRPFLNILTANGSPVCIQVFDRMEFEAAREQLQTPPVLPEPGLDDD